MGKINPYLDTETYIATAPWRERKTIFIIVIYDLSKSLAWGEISS